MSAAGDNGESGSASYQVRLTSQARADIQSAHAWLSMHASIEYADRWEDGLTTELKRLAYLPARFAVALESDHFAVELRRMLYFGPSARRQKSQIAYRVLYRIEESGSDNQGIVWVLHVWHGAKEPIIAP